MEDKDKEDNANTQVHKKSKANPDTPYDRTYEEIANENEHLGKRIRQLLSLVTELEKEKTQMKKEICDLKEDVISRQTERGEQHESKCMKQLEECKRKIKELENERDLAKRPTTVKTALNPNTTTSNEKEMNERVSGVSPSASSCDSGISMNADSFNDRLTSFQLDIERKIENMIDDKLRQKQFGNFPVEEAKLISHIEQESLEQAPDKDRDRNVIIHGLEEEEGSTDKERIDEIFETTNMGPGPVSFYRLGGKKPGANRPIMLRMQTATDKEEFMSNLWMLKQLQTKFKKLSITHDYTKDERKAIRELVDEAKKRNDTVTKGFIWKVRGMRLTKMTTRE